MGLGGLMGRRGRGMRWRLMEKGRSRDGIEIQEMLLFERRVCGYA
jgi:hypothetical protein